MGLENRSLKLVREYDAQKAADAVAEKVGTAACIVGGLGTLLFISDLGSNSANGGWSFQPSWTPGYELNHDGIRQWGELAYLGGYIGATIAGALVTGKVAGSIAKVWKSRHSGKEEMDEEFSANYQTLADRLLSEGTLPNGLSSDYTDALYLDLLANHLQRNSAEGVKITRKISDP